MNVLITKVLPQYREFETHYGEYSAVQPELPGLPEKEPWYGSHETVAQEAQRLTTGDRNQTYGHPLDDYTRTAALWTALLQHKLKDGVGISFQDAIRCMAAVKLSRDVHAPKRDNRVDLAGYAQCLQFADEENERRALQALDEVLGEEV